MAQHLKKERTTFGYTKYQNFGAPQAPRARAPRIRRLLPWAIGGLAVLAAIGLHLLIAPRFSPSVSGSDDRLSERCLAQPLTGLSAAASRLVTLPFLLHVGDQTVTEVSPTVALKWASADTNLVVSVNEDAARAWAHDEAAPLLNSANGERHYTRADGKEITVSGGDYGWIIDADGLADAICTHLRGESAGAIEVPMLQTAATWAVHGRDWGNRYIDADLSEQHARMYDEAGNLMWESDFVSGNTSNDHPTPEGVYQVNENKGLNQELRGLDENHDGEPDYISHVTYWIPFIDNLVAFHDAPWRWGFGGDIYQYDGSHGCVNLPSEAAMQLYDLAQPGDVVVSHW